MRKDLIELDGSEGGGQILRSALSLSPQASAAPEQGYNFAYLDEQTKR
ncbi:hypothetical protein, partial [Pseudomonas aeruginosa]